MPSESINKIFRSEVRAKPEKGASDNGGRDGYYGKSGSQKIFGWEKGGS
jgi:hypothetical protein